MTGTFNNWTKKIRMNKRFSDFFHEFYSQISHVDFSTVINLPPGKHKLKFVVDDEWKCSEDFPIQTDQGGNLVNYLEIADDSGDHQNDGLDGITRIAEGLIRWTHDHSLFRHQVNNATQRLAVSRRFLHLHDP